MIIMMIYLCSKCFKLNYMKTLFFHYPPAKISNQWHGMVVGSFSSILRSSSSIPPNKISTEDKICLDIYQYNGLGDKFTNKFNLLIKNLNNLSTAEVKNIFINLKDESSTGLDSFHELLQSLSACTKTKALDIKEILSEIKKSGLTPSKETYINLLFYVSSLGDVNQMTDVLSIMKDAGVPLSETTFNYIILGYGRAGNISEAENALALMQSSGILPSPATYTMLLKVTAEFGDPEKFNYYLKKYFFHHHQEFSDLQRLDIIKSFPIGKFDHLIPKVLEGGTWKRSVNLTNAIISACRQLIYNSNIDSGYVLLDSLSEYVKTISDVNCDSSYGLFFIKDLVNSDSPVEKIVEICDKLNHCNPYALFRATETALANSKQSVAIQLLQGLSEKGHILRPHYFWPLFTHAGKNLGESGVLQVLDSMLKLNVVPDSETLAEWVCNHCNILRPFELVRKFQDRKLSLSITLPAVVNCLLFHKQLKEAALVCQRFQTSIQIDKEKFFKLLSLEYFRTGDVNSIVTILKSVKDKNIGNDLVKFIVMQQYSSRDENMLINLIKALRKNRFSILQPVNEEVNDSSKNNVININNHINSQPYITHPRHMNFHELEEHLLELKSKNMNTRGVLRRLLQEHSRLRNVKRVLEIKTELENSGTKFSAGMKASLLDTFIESGLILDAEKCYADIKENNPEFRIDPYKVIELASLYVRCNQYQKSFDVLKKEDKIIADKSFSKNCWRLLKTVAEKEGLEKTKEMFNILINNNYCKIDNNILGPLIKAALDVSDFSFAINIYEKYSLKHKCTPLLHELLCALFVKEKSFRNDETVKHIEKNNIYSEYLENIVTIANKVHGEDSINIAIIVALAECDFVRELNNFVSESCPCPNFKFLLDRCDRLVDENKLEVLIRIIKAVESLPNIKRETLYETLLKVYVRRNDCDGALALWTSLQEKNVNITDLFLKDLSLLLKSNKRKVPFVISS